MNRKMTEDRISLAYWFPILKSTGVKVPKTDWWHTEADFWEIIDGKPDPAAAEFLDDLKRRTNQHGYPLFLRTGHTSGKHSWKDTCYVTKEDDLGRCVFGLLEYSAMAMPSLAWNVWAIREFLPLDIHFIAFWGEMPIATERRYFIESGAIICSHPYWPHDAFVNTSMKPDNWSERLDEMNAIKPPSSVKTDSEHVSNQLSGAWSLDWARHRNGDWYAIDMAPAVVSYHWPDCPNA